MFVCGRKAAQLGQTAENFLLSLQRGGRGSLRRQSLGAHGAFLTKASRTFGASQRHTQRISCQFELKVPLILVISIANRRNPAPTCQRVDFFHHTPRVPS